MYEHIKSLSHEDITFLNYHEFQIINNCSKSLIDMTTLAKCIDSNIRVKMFSNLCKSKKTYINNLKVMHGIYFNFINRQVYAVIIICTQICNSISELNMSCVDILKKIGEEEGFNVEYGVSIVNKSGMK